MSNYIPKVGDILVSPFEESDPHYMALIFETNVNADWCTEPVFRFIYNCGLIGSARLETINQHFTVMTQGGNQYFNAEEFAKAYDKMVKEAKGVGWNLPIFKGELINYDAPCDHQWIDVGFQRSKIVCKKCDKEQ